MREKSRPPVRNTPSRGLPPVEESPWLELKNPHAVRAVIKARPQDVKELVFINDPQGLWIRLAEQAEDAKIPVKYREQKEIRSAKARAEVKQERVGHAFALVAPKAPVSLETLFPAAGATPAEMESGNRPPLWLALDSLTDPHNVGAIFRTAGFFGVRGIVVTRNASAPINATVMDIAAGGVEAVPFAVESNLNRCLKLARRCGLWNLGTTEHSERTLWDVDRHRPWLVVVGNEQKGLRRLVLENCDEVCSIPPTGEVTSLNVSVAAGVMLAVLAGDRR